MPDPGLYSAGAEYGGAYGGTPGTWGGVSSVGATQGLRGGYPAYARGMNQPAISPGFDIFSFLPPELRSELPAIYQHLNEPPQGWGYEEPYGFMHEGALAPRGPEGLGQIGAITPELAAQQADYYGLSGLAKETFVNARVQGFLPSEAAAQGGYWNQYSLTPPPNISENPALAEQYYRLMQGARETGIEPQHQRAFQEAIGKAVPPAYENAPLYGYQTTGGQTLGEILPGAMKGFSGQQIKRPEPNFPEMLSQLEKDNPYFLYTLRAIDYLNNQLYEDEVARAQLEEKKAQISQGVGLSEANVKTWIDTIDAEIDNLLTPKKAEEIGKEIEYKASLQLPLKSLPYYTESKNIVGDAITRYGNISYEQQLEGWRQQFGAYQGREAPGISFPEDQYHMAYTSWVTSLGVSPETVNWLSTQFPDLFSKWQYYGKSMPFIEWVQMYLGG